MRVEPTVTSRPFHESVAAGTLAYPRCRECDTWHAYPRPWCTRCLHGPLDLVAVAGVGTVYAVSVVERAVNPAFADDIPYAHVLIDLPEGFRVMAMMVTDDPRAVRAGDPVRARMPTGDGPVVYEPAPTD
ncbi:MAG TPA: OB-fold domain-containing protein [Pseudonocardia sp.]|jgi:hypothetical protein|nr:OB-fold domain-containing protein [Pseudonocardia sp.]